MRKIIVLSFISLDGVMQAPGAPEEDLSGGFEYGGWVFPYFDEIVDKVMEKQMKPADLLLGRKTYEIFAGHWPSRENAWPGINNVTKYVMSSTLEDSDPLVVGWNNSAILRNLEDLKALKNSAGSDIQVHGSGELIQQLLQHDLVDELWLKIFPLTLGKGKKLFGHGPIASAYSLTESLVTPSGVIIANYKRAGNVETGSFAG